MRDIDGVPVVRMQRAVTVCTEDGHVSEPGLYRRKLSYIVKTT